MKNHQTNESHSTKKERIGKNMELKFVIPNMEKTFGNLEFAGEDKVVQRRINGQLTILSRSYNLYSDVQRADDIVVVLPAEAGEKGDRVSKSTNRLRFVLLSTV